MQPDPASRTHPVKVGIGFLLIAIVGWGITWPVNKLILETVSPFWLAAIRSGIGALALFAIAIPRARLVVPTRHDMPVVLSITLLHMVAFALLAVIGLQFVPVGRSLVLAYTTPLWVMPGAALLLGERLTVRRVVGVALGLVGLAVLFNPFVFDWSSRSALIGHGLLLVAALCWAASILHVRGHDWRATPFQLVPWEALLATVILLAIAYVAVPWVPIDWNLELTALMIVTSIAGVAIPYWAVAMAGRSLSAISVSQGLLGAPIAGVVFATLALGEAPEVAVWIALVFVIGGVVVGTAGGRSRRRG